MKMGRGYKEVDCIYFSPLEGNVRNPDWTEN